MMLSHVPEVLSHAWLSLCAVVLDQNEFIFGKQLVSEVWTRRRIVKHVNIQQALVHAIEPA